MPDSTRPFVDRQEAIKQFQELLDLNQPGTPPFLNFYGIGGIGKSFLLDHLCKNYTQGWTVIHETFESGGAELDYNGFLSKIIRKIKPKLSKPALIEEFETERTLLLQSQQQQISMQNIIYANHGNIEGERVGQNIRLDEVIGKQQLQVRRRITDTFLGAFAGQKPFPLLLCLDATENQTGEIISEKETPDFISWLICLLLEMRELSDQFRVCLCGRSPISWDSWQTHCRSLELTKLPNPDVTDYLTQLGVTDPGLIEAIYRLTGGYSLSVAMVGDLWLESNRTLKREDLETPDFRAAYHNRMVPEFLYRRILDRVDQTYRPIIQLAGYFRNFNYEILQKTVLPDLTTDTFNHFTRYSFIRKTGPYYQYHPELARLIMERAKEQEPETFARTCRTIYDYYKSQENDERFYYGIYGQVEGIIEDWYELANQYYSDWQTGSLKLLIDLIDSVTITFSLAEQWRIHLVKGCYFSRIYQHDTALKNFSNTEHILIELDDKAGLGTTYYNIGLIYNNKGEWDKALEFYLKDEQIIKEVGDKAGLGPTYNNIGLIYSKKGEWDKALEYYGKSEQIYNQVGDKAGLGTTYNNIGLIYSKKGEWDKALDYHFKDEQITKEVGDKAGLGPTYNNIGEIYSKKGEWDNALEYYGKSEQIYIEVDDKAGLGTTYNNIGGIYYKKGEWDQALEYFGKSEQIRFEVGDKAGLGYTNLNIATIYYQLNDQQAIKRIGEAVEIFRELGAKHELRKALEWHEMINVKFNNLPLIKGNEQRMWIKFGK